MGSGLLWFTRVFVKGVSFLGAEPLWSLVYSCRGGVGLSIGLLASNRVLLYGGRALSYVVSIVTLLAHSIPPPTLKEGQGTCAWEGPD